MSKQHLKKILKRIILVYPGKVLIPGGGSTRLIAMAKALSEAGFEIILVSRDIEKNDLKNFNCFHHICLYSSKMILFQSYNGNNSSFLCRNIDMLFDDYALMIVKKYNPDIVISYFAWTAGILGRLPRNVLGILDTIDIQSKRFDIARQHGVCDFDRKTSHEDEIKALKKAQVLIAIQMQEKIELENMLSGKHVICAMHGWDVKPLSSSNNSKSVLFVANYYDPNNRGIRKFIENGWLAIRNECPEATLDICGHVCEALEDFKDWPGVQLQGVVRDLEFYYKKAAVVINVSLYGTGLPIKTAEALAYGKCVVTNKSGARGFEKSNFPAIICNDEEIHSNVLEVIKNTKLRKDMELSAVRFSEKYFSNDYVYRELIEVIQKHKKRRFMYFNNTIRNTLLGKIFQYPGYQIFSYGLGTLSNDGKVSNFQKRFAMLLLFFTVYQIKIKKSNRKTFIKYIKPGKLHDGLFYDLNEKQINQLNLLGRTCDDNKLTILCKNELNKRRSGKKIGVDDQHRMICLMAGLRKYEPGVQILEKLIEENKEDFIRRPYTYGVLFMKLGKYKEAAESFLRADEENINFINARMALSYCYNKLGLKEQALNELKYVNEKEPDRIDAKDEIIKNLIDIRDYKNAFKMKKEIEKKINRKRSMIRFNGTFYSLIVRSFVVSKSLIKNQKI